MKRELHRFSISLLRHCRTHDGQFKKKKKIETDAAERLLFHEFLLLVLTPCAYVAHNATSQPTIRLEIQVYYASSS